MASKRREIVAVAVLVGGAWLAAQFSPWTSPAEPTPTKAISPPVDPAEEARKAKEHAEWVKVVLAARAIKASMKNPDSFKLEQGWRMADGSLCFSYRATNSFNAVVPGYAVYSGNKFLANGHKGFDRLWEQKCAGRSGDDITHVKRTM